MKQAQRALAREGYFADPSLDFNHATIYSSKQDSSQIIFVNGLIPDANPDVVRKSSLCQTIMIVNTLPDTWVNRVRIFLSRGSLKTRALE